MPRIDARKFGIEIECHTDNGTDTMFRYWPSDCPWDVRDDGSLAATGVELVSPPLSGKPGFDQVRKICRMLKRNDAWVEDDCGLHVHQDASDLSKDDIIRIAFSWYQNQAYIDRFLEPYRRSDYEFPNQWCQPLRKRYLESLKENGYCDARRYRVINLSALDYHGTLEFRQHHGSIDYTEIIPWVKFTQALIRSSKKRKNPIKSTPFLLDRIAVPTKDKKYLMEKAAMLAEKA